MNVISRYTDRFRKPSYDGWRAYSVLPLDRHLALMEMALERGTPLTNADIDAACAELGIDPGPPWRAEDDPDHPHYVPPEKRSPEKAPKKNAAEGASPSDPPVARQEN